MEASNDEIRLYSGKNEVLKSVILYYDILSIKEFSNNRSHVNCIQILVSTPFRANMVVRGCGKDRRCNLEETSVLRAPQREGERE